MSAVPGLTLFADDARGLIQLIADRLGSIGATDRFRTATSLSDATKILQTQPIHHLVTDWRMPGDGIQFVLNTKQRMPNLRCTLMTGFTSDIDSETRTRLDASGIDIIDKLRIDTYTLADLVGYKYEAIECIEESSEEESQKPSPDTFLQQRLRIDKLRREITTKDRVLHEFAADLLDAVKECSDLSTETIVGPTSTMNLSSMITEIENLTPKGLRLIQLDRNVRKRLLTLPARKKGQS
jgi:CheY-like chemotaxis protein